MKNLPLLIKARRNAKKVQRPAYGRFAIARTVYVEREDDRDTVFGKAFDFSGSTMTYLFEKGVARETRLTSAQSCCK